MFTWLSYCMRRQVASNLYVGEKFSQEEAQ